MASNLEASNGLQPNSEDLQTNRHQRRMHSRTFNAAVCLFCSGSRNKCSLFSYAETISNVLTIGETVEMICLGKLIQKVSKS